MVPVTDYTLRNVAWLKPAYQVTDFTDQYGPHKPRLANDGSKKTKYEVLVNGCAASEPAINPWWSVDLEVSVIVFMVNLTNRGDTYGYRSDNFVVGLTNSEDVAKAPVLYQYTLCGQYPGAVPAGATVSVQCTNAYARRFRFRYVIVQFPLVNDSLNFCEIEVFTVTTESENVTTSGSFTPGTVHTTTEKSNCPECTESNIFSLVMIAIIVVAGVFIIVAVILLIILLKQRADIKQLRKQISKPSARETGDPEPYDYATISSPEAASGYQELQMSRR